MLPWFSSSSTIHHSQLSHRHLKKSAIPIQRPVSSASTLTQRNYHETATYPRRQAPPIRPNLRCFRLGLLFTTRKYITSHQSPTWQIPLTPTPAPNNSIATKPNCNSSKPTLHKSSTKSTNSQAKSAKPLSAAHREQQKKPKSLFVYTRTPAAHHPACAAHQSHH